MFKRLFSEDGAVDEIMRKITLVPGGPQIRI
jgi:hypothetical protein